MSREVSAIIGSGTIPLTYGILSPANRGNVNGAEGVRTGMQVILANPEDINAVDAFATSGVSIGVTPTLIWGPYINPLPRQQMVVLHNQGPNTLFIGQNSTSVIAPSGMIIPAGSVSVASVCKLSLPFMKNVEIWAAAPGVGGTQVSILAY